MDKHSAVFFDKNPLVLCLVDVIGQAWAGRRETIIHNVKPCGKPLGVSPVNGRFVPYAVIRGGGAKLLLENRFRGRALARIAGVSALWRVIYDY